MKCPNCGAPLRNQARFCGNCGQRIGIVTQESQHSRNTSNTPQARSDSRGGKFESAPSKRPPKKKSRNGVLRIGVLIVLIVVLICIFMFVIRPLIGSVLSGENNENRQSSAAQVQIESDAENSGGSFLSGADNKTQTIYVVDGMSMKSQNADYAMIYTYAYNEDGFPLQRNIGYSDSRWDALTTYYAYDFDGIMEEIIAFTLEASDLGDNEREKKEELYSSELNNILEAYSINPDDSVYELLGIKDDLVTATTSGSSQTVIKYNSQGKKIEQISYSDGEIVAKTTVSYLADNKLYLVETYNKNIDMYFKSEYTYDSGDDMVSVKYTQTQGDNDPLTTYYKYYYDRNGMQLKTENISKNGEITNYTYHYKTIEIPEYSVDLLCNVYDYIGIHYVMEEEGVSVTDTLSEEEMAASTAPAVDWEGNYTLSMVKNQSGFYVLYPDSSLDTYHTGNTLVWEGPDPMTYGADYTPKHLLMYNGDITSNAKNLSNGELVLVCPYDNRVRSGIVPIAYSGMTMSRVNEDGKKEAVFVSKVDTGVYFDLWISGHSIYNTGFNCNTINGVPVDEYGVNFDYSGYNRYLSLPKDETYTLGVVSGASLIETEYFVNCTYFFQENVVPFELKLNPTVDGYATIDFSGIPAGEYVLYYSYWSEEDDARVVLTTYVVVS